MPRLAPLALALVLSLVVPATAQEAKIAINPSQMPDSLQFGYSQAAVAPAGGRTIYVAGQVGVVEDGPNDFRSQVDRAFDNMAAALEAAGGGVEDVVKITLLIADHDPNKLAYLVEKRRAVFGDAPPASLLIPVTRLYTDGVSFEIDATAVAPAR